MKTLRLLALILTLGGAVLGQAQTAPPVINYQGRLTQATGVVVPDGLTGMRVRIFATASGGSALWDSGDLSVATKSGTFSILLGSGGMPAMSPVVFALGTVYIEVQPNGQAPLLPRQPIASVPWAFYAQTVSDGAINNAKLADNAVGSAELLTDNQSLAKVSGGALFVNSEGNLVSPPGYRLGLGVTGNPVTRLEVVGNTRLAGDLSVTGNSSVTGTFGIGISSPERRLDVAGRIRAVSDSPGTNSDSAGVWAQGFYGVYGEGGQFGVGGVTTHPSGAAIYGFAPSSGGNASGGHFRCENAGGNAVYAINTTNGTGLTAISTGGTAGYFSGIVYITNGELQCNGAARKPGGGEWSVLSDARLKKNIKDIETPLARLLALHGREFEYRHPKAIHEREGRVIGFVAQEVERAFPQWVGSSPSGYKDVTIPSDFNALTVEAIRDLKEENQALRAALERERAARIQTDRKVAELGRLVQSIRR